MFDDLPSGARDAASFKRVGDRFVFRVPGPWPFAARHVLVTVSERDAINARLRATSWRPARGLILIVGVLIIQAGTGSALVAPALVAMMALQESIFRFYRWQKLAPLVAGLPPTNERYSLYERLQNTASLAPLWQLTLFDLASVGFLVLFALRRVDPPTDHLIAGHGATTWALIAICGWLTIYAVVLTCLKILPRSSEA